MGLISRNKIHGFVLCVIIAVTPSAVASGPPCLAYAYAVDKSQEHYSLIASDSYVFGTAITVVSNCNNTQIIIDDVLSSQGNYSVSGYASPGLHNVTLKNSGFQVNYTNVVFIDNGGLAYAINNLPAQFNPDSKLFTPDEITNIQLFAGIGSILISWVLAVGVLWRLIQAYQERNYVEEVF
tara:strand:- start:304 stop:846 length:543 start_codon:yes stop_codon:yes gene_type:complete